VLLPTNLLIVAAIATFLGVASQVLGGSF